MGETQENWDQVIALVQAGDDGNQSAWWQRSW